jgi:Flp pilus assembly protein TadB
MDQPPQQTNGLANLLHKLAASGDRWVQFGIVVLVGLSGLGNWAATWNSADRNKAEIEISRRVAWEGEQRIKAQVSQQVAEIHKWMREATDEFHKGNEDSAYNRNLLDQIKKELDEMKESQKK